MWCQEVHEVHITDFHEEYTYNEMQLVNRRVDFSLILGVVGAP